MKRTVYFNNEPLPGDGETYVEIPRGNERMWSVELINYRRGSRVRSGTCTTFRVVAIIEAVKSRYPEAVKSKQVLKPLVIRTRRAGKIVATFKPLDGPAASVATKH